MKLLIILTATLLLNSQTITMTHKPTPLLSKGEKRFKSFKLNNWRDFNLGWRVNYFDVVTFSTKPYNGKKFKLPKNAKLKELFHIGQSRDIFGNNYAKYLAKAIMKPKYFWKYAHPLLHDYTFYSLRFIDAKDNILKAIETLEELKQFLGDIDTPAELNLWIMASEKFKRAYSYKKIGNLYRVRFFDSDLGGCYFHEYFYYYNKNGKVIKKQEIKKVKLKGCVEVMI